jgi:LysR family transcriptional regulator, glycine cleavage system transcriptional activator
MNALPSLTALRCFDASARLGSFTLAADAIHLTQSAVSHQVLGLEALLGVALFERRRSGLSLTVAGRAYHGPIRAALREIERATQDLRTLQGRGGSLRLSVAPGFASYWLMPRLSGFVAAHPEVTLHLATQIGAVDFQDARVDACIEFGANESAHVVVERIWPLTLQAYAAPGLVPRRALSARKPQLASADLLALLRHHPLIQHATVPEAWPEWLAAAGLSQSIAASDAVKGPVYDLLSMAHNGAIAGIGIALLPDFVAAHALAAGQLLRLSTANWTAQRAYCLRYPSVNSDLPALVAFRAWVAREAKASRLE